MPTDVVIGAGYCGEDLLQHRFPNQYRDPQHVQTFDTSGYMAQFPGAASGHPAAVTVPTDPDRGRPLMFQNIPGVGQVVVPVTHEMVGLAQGSVVPVEHDVAGIAQISPVEHTMVGEDEGFDGLGDISTREKLAEALACKAAKAVDRALRGIASGRIKTLADAEKFVSERMQKVSSRYAAIIQKLAESARKKALEESRSRFEEALSKAGKQTGAGDFGLVTKGGEPSSLKAEAQRFVSIISDIAGKTAAKAVDMARRGTFKSLGQAQEFIRSSVVGVTQRFVKKLLPLAEKAAMLAFNKVKGDLEAALKSAHHPFESAAPDGVPPASGAVSDSSLADFALDAEHGYNLQNWRGAMYGTSEDLKGSMLGDWKSDIASAIASKELDQLVKSIFRVQDYLSDAIAQRNPVAQGYREAKRLLDDSLKIVPAYIVVGFTQVPNPLLIPQLTAVASAKQGIAYFARQVQTLNEISVVFLNIANILSEKGLKTDAESINTTYRQILKFSTETDAVMRDITYYNDVKMNLIAAFNSELASAGISKTDYGNPGWFQAFLRAADKVVPIPDAAKKEVGLTGFGMGDLGALPVLIGALIAVILSVGAVLVALKAVSRLIPDQNSKAETARQLLLKAQERKAAVEMQMRAQGATEDEIKARLSEIDKETEAAVGQIPEPKSPLASLALPAGIIAGGAILLKIAGVL